MTPRFAVVDLFSGPGGLGEGFAAYRDSKGKAFYQSCLSVEMDAAAHRTLLLRSFYWQFNGTPPDSYYGFLNGDIPEPDWSRDYPREWRAAASTALRLELGRPGQNRTLNQRIDEIAAQYADRTVLLGGPPCQAYSLVGRARNGRSAGVSQERDSRTLLYQQYVKTLSRLRPAAFVMENVKGLLSATVGKDRILPQILRALRNACGQNSYQLLTLYPEPDIALGEEVPPANAFVVRAEYHGVPQARHRVFIVGIRTDLATVISPTLTPRLDFRDHTVPLRTVLSSMPRLRSGLSNNDSPHSWQNQIRRACSTVSKTAPPLLPQTLNRFHAAVGRAQRHADRALPFPRSRAGNVSPPPTCPLDLSAWIRDDRLRRLPNNETRSHMPQDLARYLFAAAFASACGYSPKAHEFPARLAPAHRNWRSGDFSDRFRVQVFDRPATTITSHISKDGHYFIHPDSSQCRSLTVREAARLQTFPDNYHFHGNRTEQYVQVGNAVPPFLAQQIASSLVPALARVDQALLAAGRRKRSGGRVSR